MDNQDDKPPAIQLLPYDIVILILEYVSIPDIVRFGSTCKQFNELIKSSPSLWKLKLRNSVSGIVHGLIKKNPDCNWFNEVKKYNSLQSEVHSRLIDMAAYYYRCSNDINLYDVRQFLHNTYDNGFSYYCTIEILQEFLKRANKNTFLRFGNKPYTLTEMYYSKIALRHLIHPFLTIRWVQAHVKNDASPEFVLNFFVQWVDPLAMHSPEQVDNAIDTLANMVEKELRKIHPTKCDESIQQQCANGDILEAQIIAAISEVMYKQKRMTPLSVCNLETLDIVKVIEMGCGHDVAIAAIFGALAKKFGVWCELIAFSSHLFLELRGSQNKTHQRVFKIELDSGKLTPKRSCPFSRTDGFSDSTKYCPDSLIKLVISSYLMPMGSYKTWYMQNAIFLMDFLSINQSSVNKYKHYLPYLRDNSHLPVLASPVQITNLTVEQLKIITLLSYLAKSTSPPHKRELVVCNRSKKVKYAVGMVVQHHLYNYTGVIRGWEHGAAAVVRARAEPRPLKAGHNQPFYIVLAVDQTERYVAQEHLFEVPQPTRLYHLEDIIAKEFTHFNDFAYEPNVHKQIEFPDDLAVSEQYRIRAEQLYGHNLT